jgi:nucleoside-diphosphate-sugar epimerase
MPDEILVTGASGFVGRSLVAALQARGETVRTFSETDGDIARHTLDFPGVGCVYHLAARTFVPDSWRDPRPFFETNVLGAVNVLEFCRRQQASLILMSSYVYGRPRSLPIAEDHPLEAFNPYSLTKIQTEEITAFYRDRHRVATAIIRPFNLYGPGQRDQFLIPMLIRQALNPALDCFEVADDRPRRDQLFLDDLIDLLLRCRTCPGGTYNAGSGVSSSIADIVDVLNNLMGLARPLRSRGESRPDDVMDVVADIRRAKADLGWEPRVNLRDGLAATLAATLATTRP